MENQTLEQKILAYLTRTPEANMQRIANAMGLGGSQTENGWKPCTEVKDAVWKLLRSGQIEEFKPPFAERSDKPKYRLKAVAKSAAKQQATDSCRVTLVDPKAGDRLERFKPLVDAMEVSGVIQPLAKLSRNVCFNSNWARTNSQAKAYYNEAVQRMKTPKLESTSSTVEVPTTDETRQQLEVCQARIRELEAALTQVRQQNPTNPYDWVFQQHQIWQQTVEQLRADLAFAEANLQAFELLRGLYE